MARDTADTNPGGPIKRRASLRNRFLLLFILLFLAGSFGSYAVMRWFTRDVIDRLGSWFAEKSVLYEKARALQLLVRETTLAQKMASSPVLKAWVKNESDPKSKARALASLEDYREFFRSKSYFFAIARSGNYYFDDETKSADPGRPRYVLSETIPKDAWFYATLRNVPDYQLNVDTDRHLKVTKVWINAVLKDDGQALAVIGTGVDLSDFIASVINTSQPGVTNVLLDRNGAIQAHRDISVIDFASIAKAQRNEKQSTLFDLIDDANDQRRFQQALADLADGKADTRTLQASIQGKRHIVGIAYLPGMNWFMVSLTHPESAENPNYFYALVGVRIAGLALMLIILGIIFDRLVLRRLARLDAAARQISAGNYVVQLSQSGSDELSRLGHAFQEMANRIAAHTNNLEQQVSERTQVLARQAEADFLTGLLNRRGIGERIRVEKNRLAREGGKLGMLLLDVDHFKTINDNYGHELGDRALIHAANAIRGVMRSYDLCARWGGEEFLVLVPRIVSRDALAIVAEKLRAEIKSKPVAGQIFLTVSIGGYFASPSENTDAILKAADEALYMAKQAGRDRCVVTDTAAPGSG